MSKTTTAKATKTKTTKTKTTGEYGSVRSHDLPWCEKKAAIFKALKKLGAVSPMTAVSSSQISEKAECSERDVRHYCYHASAAGLVALISVEGQRGFGFHLTKSGLAVDPAVELKQQKSGKTA